MSVKDSLDQLMQLRRGAEWYGEFNLTVKPDLDAFDPFLPLSLYITLTVEFGNAIPDCRQNARLGRACGSGGERTVGMLRGSSYAHVYAKPNAPPQLMVEAIVTIRRSVTVFRAPDRRFEIDRIQDLSGSGNDTRVGEMTTSTVVSLQAAGSNDPQPQSTARTGQHVRGSGNKNHKP
ncbi:hypothetical protein B0H34DRAFT_674797 [Crassisporium funariophilum]|nr:hypothetical protein B0H34DRAFT_674797 [Crassisporium funariophilum]